MTGPYVVKRLEPCAHCEGGGEVWGEDPDTGLPDEPGLKSRCGRCEGEGARVVSVKAFETLEEARDWIIARLEMLGDDSHRTRGSMSIAEAKRVVEWLTEESSSFTLSALPDGSEIVVEATNDELLLDELERLRVGWLDWWGLKEILEAFNAAMAERYGTEGRA